jgi:hypothetical protein
VADRTQGSAMTERAIPILPCRSFVVFYVLPIVFLSGLVSM